MREFIKHLMGIVLSVLLMVCFFVMIFFPKVRKHYNESVKGVSFGDRWDSEQKCWH